MSKSTIRQAEPKQQFNVGSTAFFSCYYDFKPSDTDEVIFEDEPKLYKNVLQIRKKDGTRCIFKWRKMTADEFVDYTLHSKLPMEMGKFLVPEVADYLGFTLEHLKMLSPVAEKLDAKHQYEKVIFDSYLQNGGYYLTGDQRLKAYIEYLKYR